MSSGGEKVKVHVDHTMTCDFQEWDDRIDKKDVERFVWVLAMDERLEMRFIERVELQRKTIRNHMNEMHKDD